MKKILSFFREKLFTINDSPHKIALGFGLGVFAGILPGTGPIASVFLALLCRANSAAALVGSLLTNTWLSFVIFTVSLQTGAFLTRTDWRNVYNQCRAFLENFHWRDIFSAPVWAIVKPLLVGYLVMGLLLGLAAYGVTLGLILFYHRGRKDPS